MVTFVESVHGSVSVVSVSVGQCVVPAAGLSLCVFALHRTLCSSSNQLRRVQVGSVCRSRRPVVWRAR